MVLRPMPKKEVVDCLKRAASLIWNEDGVLKKIEYLGYNKLPYKAVGPDEGQLLEEGSFFLYHISLPQSGYKNLTTELKLDLDILKSRINKANESVIPDDYECTLSEEMLPPFYRKSVQPLLDYKNVRADVRR